MPPRPDARRSRLPRRLLLLGAAALAVWIGFFDSHSVYRRVQWHREYRALVAENERLARETRRLEAQLRAAPTDETIERIAREQYGMRRPGETVYRVIPRP